MPWYVWLLIIVVVGSIAGGLLTLLRTAKPLPLTDEQLQRIYQREAEQQAKDEQRP